MNGKVDDRLRTLIDVEVSSSSDGSPSSITAWIDTAFNGQFVFPRHLIERLKLAKGVGTEAILADGSKVVLEAYIGYLRWFGNAIAVQVIANDGVVPLLGTELLADRVLHIDYPNGLLTLE